MVSNRPWILTRAGALPGLGASVNKRSFSGAFFTRRPAATASQASRKATGTPRYGAGRAGRLMVAFLGLPLVAGQNGSDDPQPEAAHRVPWPCAGKRAAPRPTPPPRGSRRPTGRTLLLRTPATGRGSPYPRFRSGLVKTRPSSCMQGHYFRCAPLLYSCWRAQAL